MQIKNFRFWNHALFLIIPIIGFGLITAYAQCIFTFCKSSPVSWLDNFLIPIPIVDGLFIAIILMLPISLYCDNQRIGIIALIMSAVTISLVKHLPDFNPQYDYYNVVFDLVWALVPLCLGFYIPYILRGMVQKYRAKAEKK